MIQSREGSLGTTVATPRSLDIKNGKQIKTIIQIIKNIIHLGSGSAKIILPAGAENTNTCNLK